MEFTKIPTNTFETIQMNAGIFVDSFDPATMEIGSILGATSGGATFSDSITYKDFGEDIDNCPKNTMELKKLESHDVKCSGSLVTVTAATAKKLAAAADIDTEDTTHIIPRNDLKQDDFADIWWVGDYSDVNDGANAGYIAIHMMNALSTGGISLKSTDKDKGKFDFEFTSHYSIRNADKVPYEMYVKQGASGDNASNEENTGV